MRLFNTYGARLGVTPYYGSEGPRTNDLLATQAALLGVPRGQLSLEERNRRVAELMAERRNASPEGGF